MIRSDSLYETCQELFAAYPLAVEACDGNDATHSMVLIFRRGDDAGFCLLLQESGDEADGCSYRIRLWHDEAALRVHAATRAHVPDTHAEAVTTGIPIPRDGSLFGWWHGDTVKALLVTYTQQTPETPEPSWAVMPLAGTPESEWPPFAGEPLFGNWFWEHYRAGRLVVLDDLIAATAGTVFWADTAAVIGSNCAVVAHDIKISEVCALPRGRYVYHQALRTGESIPSLDTLLADDCLYDLAPQFA